MPPRMAPGQRGGEVRAGRGAGSPGRGRGAGPAHAPSSRGGRGGGRGGASGGAVSSALAPLPSGVQPMGMARPSFGTAGRAIKVRVNALTMDIPNLTVYHYDAFESERGFRVKFNHELIDRLIQANGNIFSAPCGYDGRKNLYSTEKLPLGPKDSQMFQVVVDARGKPKVFKITLTIARIIDMEILRRYVDRQQSWDENVSTAITALNVATRMAPARTYPSRGRSIYSLNGSRPIGQGLEAVRGYFQSIRPTFDRVIINIDISTGVMYRKGPLIDLCLDFFGAPAKSNPSQFLAATGNRAMPAQQRLLLQRFLSGVQVTAKTASGQWQEYTIHKLTDRSAKDLIFKDKDGKTVSVAQYFQKANQPVRFVDLICIETKKKVQIPLERCDVVPGQLSRAQLTPDAQREVVAFSTQKPQERLNEIRKGLQVLAYGQSDYVRAFGLNIDEASLPLEINARVIEPPVITYGAQSKSASVRPRDGAWNMIDKKFIQPSSIAGWIILFFVPENFFRDGVDRLKDDFIQVGCKPVGINVQDNAPLIQFCNPRGNIEQEIIKAGKAYSAKRNVLPTFVLCILPDHNNTDIYNAIKHWGDIKSGVVTQCLKAGKARGAKPQYWANVMLKVNAKLGGINSVPEASPSTVINDPSYPTIVMGADVMHPAPGSDSPSNAAVVGSIDSNGSRYISRTTIQASRLEMIQDLKTMAQSILEQAVSYRQQVDKKTGPWKRLIFFRDGVSEGEFRQVLDQELPLLKAACQAAKLNVTITFVIVGKRHHVRFFPSNEKDQDRSGNSVAGTVVDRDITSPVEYDFYLQSHGGLLGTSRSSHYIVVHDENKFGPDRIQSLAYTLCHTYARATRSVSIPAPVYYAHIVCSRAKTHYDPSGQSAPSIMSGGTSSSADRAAVFEQHRAGYKPVNAAQARRMYFM